MTSLAWSFLQTKKKKKIDRNFWEFLNIKNLLSKNLLLYLNNFKFLISYFITIILFLYCLKKKKKKKKLFFEIQKQRGLRPH